ncbi:MAG: protein kinase domain-containing protein [Acidobacteriota bacterium]
MADKESPRSTVQGRAWNDAASDAPTHAASEFDVPPAPPRLADGQRFGQYAIVRPLGRGGMGEVYEAEEVDSGRRLALKLLTRGFESTDRARFLREGRLAASVNHPNTVYVYGTETIDGVPVIAMELMAGGTLADQVRADGPLQATAAVDVIRQIIAGLDAAARAGVLHRDIKPSNCFVGSDGVVKVGDFGLSISTDRRDETVVTLTGMIVGTPAFCSPEQLRGETLDVRSDIYAVGATLYYLLTGRTPFEGANVMRLLTAVAREAPRSPAAWGPDIPRGLAKVVLRCLAKDARQRYATYEALASAIAPYGRAAETPATLGLRVTAYLMDTGLLALGFLAAALYVESLPISASTYRGLSLTGWLTSAVVFVLYFSSLEGRWGCSLGKAAAGLRVVTGQGQLPGFSRAFTRALLFEGSGQIPAFASLLIFGWERVLDGRDGVVALLQPLGAILVLALLFSTARRRNGFAARHDLATGTRVVSRVAVQLQARPPAAAPAGASAPSATSESVGPYRVVDSVAGSPFAVAYDPLLLRRVWVRIGSPETPPVPGWRRELARFGRLRWLAGRRSPSENWDAFEAPEGAPLAASCAAPRAWAEVRHWLRDLAEELAAGSSDGTLPPLTLDRVWITRDGRARLLDWPVAAEPASSNGRRPVRPPDAREESPWNSTLANLTDVQRFLHETAMAALGLRQHAARHPRATPLPLAASAWLATLAGRGFTSDGEILAGVTALEQRPSTVTRRRRGLHLALSGAVPLAALATLFGVAMMGSGGASRDVDLLARMLRRLTTAEQVRERTQQHAAEIEALEVYIAGPLRASAQAPSTWEARFIRRQLTAADRARAERILSERQAPSPGAVANATRTLEAFIARGSGLDPRMWLVLLLVGLIAPLPVACLSCFGAFLFRSGFVFRALGIAVVRPDGREVSRLRALWRSTVAWAPLAITPVTMIALGGPTTFDDTGQPVGYSAGYAVGRWMASITSSRGEELTWVALTSLAVVLIGTAWALIHPARGLPDRLAGTFLVPR